MNRGDLSSLRLQEKRARELAENSPDISVRIGNREIAMTLAAQIAAVEASDPDLG